MFCLRPLLWGSVPWRQQSWGAVLAAVSPAVVVPRMVQLMEEKCGTKKRIPQMILAGASLDDVFVIVLFTTFVAMTQGEGASLLNFVSVPVSVVFGILMGCLAGVVLAWFFERCHFHRHTVRNSMKVIIVMGTAFFRGMAQ